MAVRIEFCDEVSIPPVIKKNFSKLVRAVFQGESLKLNCEINFHFVDEEKIRLLNLKFRKIDNVTDVLSFPLLNQNEIKRIYKTSVLLGDIVICWPRAQFQAAEYGHGINRESAFLCVHGLLHLIGYDHEEKEDELKMLKKQNLYLNLFDFSRCCDA